jgi:5-methylcytosine-specific restriction endonuclease McrBC regulatory subunit McrC
MNLNFKQKNLFQLTHYIFKLKSENEYNIF